MKKLFLSIILMISFLGMRAFSKGQDFSEFFIGQSRTELGKDLFLNVLPIVMHGLMIRIEQSDPDPFFNQP
jgi:hypothetical protein